MGSFRGSYPIQPTADNPERMDSRLLADLQAALQHHAKREGIDVTHQAHWTECLKGTAD